MHLLKRNGVAYDHDDLDRCPPELPKVDPRNGLENLLDSIELDVKLNTNRTVGFLLDADCPLSARWESVKERLIKVGVSDLTNSPPARGFISESVEYKVRVGVWLMPDNVNDGKLEDVLKTLIEENDPLLEHAEESALLARCYGAVFTENDRIKAIIHTWLAWQKEPGLPYGLAMRAKFFRHDSKAANAFVQWFKNLYQIG